MQSRSTISAFRIRWPGGDLGRNRRVPLFSLASGKSGRYTLNLMVQYSEAGLNASFAALSDATRRGVLEQLGHADASITELADKFHMTLTGMKKHVEILEQAGLVATKKVGRVRSCRLGPRRLEKETAWLEEYRRLWAAQFDELDKVVEELKRKEDMDERKTRPNPPAGPSQTTVERRSERELVVTRSFKGPARVSVPGLDQS